MREVLALQQPVFRRSGWTLCDQGSHRLEKYLNLEGFKSLKIKHALKITGKSHKDLEKSLNSSIF